MKKVVAVFRLWVLLAVAGAAGAQTPTDNPYASRYHVKRHWTDSLAWHRVTSARDVKGLVDTAGRVDSLAMQEALRAIARQGGGVLYFPAGTYYFDYQLNLVSNVLLRGANPAGVTEARSEGYAPPTRFEFPRYQPVRTGEGAPHDAFKRIYADTTGLENFGLVNVDLNRATIGFFAGGYAVADPETKNRWPASFHRNVILFGIRHNNAVVPHPNIPTKIMTDEGHGWQRWPWLFGANIDVFVSRNCVVANCRLNDNVTDDFDQDNYLDDDGSYFTGQQARFRYADHPGINVNVSKTHLRTGSTGSGDTWAKGKWNPYEYFFPNRLPVTAASEPAAFFPGIEALDNYVRTTSRYYGITDTMTAPDFRLKYSGLGSINASGRDLKMAGNRIDSISIPYFLDRNGDFTTIPIFNPTALFDRDTYVTRAGDTLPYRLMPPQQYDPRQKYPLVLFLHGVGERGTDNENQLKQFVWMFATAESRRQFPCFVLAPQHPDKISWNSKDATQLAWPTQASLDVIGQLAGKYNIDRNRIYVTGFSTGGRGTWELLVHQPRLFAAAVPVASYFNVNEKQAKALRRLPVWAFHGELDKYFPVAYTRLLIQRLRDAGGKPRYTEYAGKGHLSWGTVPHEKDLLPWLFSQKR